ncbi:MAG: O-antigen ligase family protein [Anaerolineae bacterium]|nr:O-antigen ligase family protein [Anaerolineae bacterium]
MTPGPRCRSLLEAGALVVASLLPLCFNPLAPMPFEPCKVAAFGAAVAAMAGVRGACGVWQSLHKSCASAGGQAAGPSPNPLLGPYLGYVATLLLATMASVDPAVSLWGRSLAPHGLASTLAQVAFFLLSAEALTSPAQLQRAGSAIVLGTAPVAVYGIAQHLGLDPIPWLSSPAWRPFSTMGSSLFLGAYLAMALPFTLAGLARAATSADRLRYGAIIALQTLTLVLTRARSGWIGGVAGTLLFLLYLRRHGQLRRAQRLTGAVTLAGSLVLLWMMLAVPDAPLAALSRAAEGADSFLATLRLASIPDRLAIWGGTLAIMPGHWLLGYGPDTYAGVFPMRCPPAFRSLLAPAAALFDPHNVLLNQLFSAGLIGLGAFLLLLAAVGRLAVAALARAREGEAGFLAAAAACSVLAYVVYLQLNPDAVTLSALFALDLAILVSGARLAGAGETGRDSIRLAGTSK